MSESRRYAAVFEVLTLFGSVDYDADYDYKQQRRLYQGIYN